MGEWRVPLAWRGGWCGRGWVMPSLGATSLGVGVDFGVGVVQGGSVYCWCWDGVGLW